jgi:cellobiose phosphorylase
LGHFEETRKILLETFAHQFSTTGEWPQWFMLDRYGFAADDSHGDVIFWPLKILGDYLRKTSDLPLLDKRLRFQNQKTPLSLKKHVALALSAIEKRFIFGTDFLSYGGGDWDDTLQPADPSLKERLVSPWTQELAYQTLQALGEVLPRSYGERQKSLELAGRLKKGYDQSFVREGAIPGFLYVGADGKLESLVDANDEKTGIHCRLLPYTRAIISTLASPQQAQGFSALIEDKLAFPDGVRLMDVPARYDGGVSHLFVRAEEAANVGREISLCYVHADIRYAESMCVLGEAEKAFRALEKIIPIHLDEVVPNAAVRQSNVYFSSSDPDFPDRYAFAAGIESLRRGEVAVRGGWRVYSSGNGIFIARLLGDLFGLRPGLSTLIIDPVLPKEFDGSSLIVSFGGHRYEFRYHLGPKGFGLARLEIKGTPVKGLPLANPYRPAGSEFSYADLPSGVVDIFTL